MIVRMTDRNLGPGTSRIEQPLTSLKFRGKAVPGPELSLTRAADDPYDHDDRKTVQGRRPLVDVYLRWDSNSMPSRGYSGIYRHEGEHNNHGPPLVGRGRHHCGSMMYLVLNFAAVIYDEKDERKEEGDLDLRSQIDLRSII
jgi:hypothetical protein